MQIFSKTMGKTALVLALTSCVVFAYPDLQSTTAANEQSAKSAQPIASAKTENISMDYAHAHMELMKLPQELPIKSF